ncbi:MAG: AbrB/MazE/SpoVT family DNA-binding domain-containing protein [Phycisphaerae bacterium]
MPTTVQVKKWGGSMAVLIPSQFAKMRHIAVGSTVDIDSVCVIKTRRRYTIGQLLAKYQRKQRHGEWELGAPVGKEIW